MKYLKEKERERRDEAIKDFYSKSIVKLIIITKQTTSEGLCKHH